jgi:alkylation response protein AidB-like acyl-CoA dehydrogenase
MALVLTDEQSMLRDNTRSFLNKNAPIAHLRKLRDSRDPEGFSRALRNEFVKMGLAGILVPDSHGGLGLGHVEVGVVMEELGHTLTPSPFLSTAVLAASTIARAGNDQHKSEYLSRIVSGDLTGGLAVDDGTKHRPEKIAMPASRSGKGFTLNGAKTFVVDGHVADILIVAARTSGAPGETNGITLFVIDGKAKGLKAERTPMVDTHNAARLTFENVSVPADAVLGGIDRGWPVLEGTLRIIFQMYSTYPASSVRSGSASLMRKWVVKRARPTSTSRSMRSRQKILQASSKSCVRGRNARDCAERRDRYEERWDLHLHATRREGDGEGRASSASRRLNFVKFRF